MSITSSTVSLPTPIIKPLAHERYASVNTDADKNTVGTKSNTAFASSTPANSNTYTATIYGTPTAPAPGTSYTKEEQEQHVDAYADRVKTLIGGIESDQEGQRNIKFQHARQFMEPSGYFSGGLLAAGYDPHEKFKVRFTTYTGMGKPDVLTGTDIRTYFAWEIAAGALAHDKVQRGGPVNFQFMHVEKSAKGKVSELESLGRKLQGHWEKNIATPMRDASGQLAQRSGKADTYVIRGTLQSLSNDKDSFEKLSQEAKTAINRTLNHNGQVIIPNVYGFPLSGYAFIPYVPYDGNYENRPNQGLMIDLKNGAAHEIKSDDDFASWAQKNRDTLQASFNASDRQGTHDAHWPKAGDVLDDLIRGKNSSYPGYQNLIDDQAIPVRELFNYTRARAKHYELKFGNLNDNIASKYQEQNAKNAVWADQTEVFGSSQQSWKTAKDFWSNTFGYVPVVGNTGNIVFGIHDAIYGKTAEDRIGGSSAAVISALQLAHELATAGVGGAEEPPAAVLSPELRDVSWRYNSPSSDFELVRAPKAPPADEEVPTITEEPKPGTSTGTDPAKPSAITPSPRSQPIRPIAQYAIPDGEELIKNATRDANGVYRRTDSTGIYRQYVRITDETNTSRVFEIHTQYKSGSTFAGVINPKNGRVISVVTPGRDGEWSRVAGDGGLKWPWQRGSSPTPPNSLNSQFSDLFADVDDLAVTQAKKLDEYLNVDEATPYLVSTRGFEDNGVLKRKLNLSWQGRTDERVEIYDSEKAAPTEYSTSDYSPNFILDLNRSDYSVIKASKEGDLVLPLNAKGSSAEMIRQNRVKQFEEAIPDADLRARISEVAHQGSVFPANAELLNTLKEGYGAKVSGTSYFVDYDPLKNETTVRIVAKWYINDLTGDNPRVIPDIEATTTRTFTIRESNEISGDTYLIDELAPTRLEVSVPADLPE